MFSTFEFTFHKINVLFLQYAKAKRVHAWAQLTVEAWWKWVMILVSDLSQSQQVWPTITRHKLLWVKLTKDTPLSHGDTSRCQIWYTNVKAKRNYTNLQTDGQTNRQSDSYLSPLTSFVGVQILENIELHQGYKDFFLTNFHINNSECCHTCLFLMEGWGFDVTVS